MPIASSSRELEPQPRAAVEWIYFAYLLFVPLGATAMAAATYRGPDLPRARRAVARRRGVAIMIDAAFVITYLVAPTGGGVLLVILDGPLADRARGDRAARLGRRARHVALRRRGLFPRS